MAASRGWPFACALALLAGGAGAQIQIEHDVTVAGMTSDRFTWSDASGQPRVAVLAQSTGALREFRYQLPGNVTRVAGVTQTGNGASGGFGYVVSHRYEGTTGIAPADDSPLGFGIPGTFTRLFEGRHHTIFRFTQLYPRYSSTTANPPNTRYDVPVTIDWVLSTGRDTPLWALTWDLSGVPADALNDDSRAPYGELYFDGAADDAHASVVNGVAWGEGRKFTSTTAPVTMDGAWTWNVANTVPYVKLWTAVDATMGTVQTQTIAQQDAGGYWGASRWDTTSGDGNACAAGAEYPGSPAHLMPCSYNWPYQSINYSLSGNAGTTSNTRLAWGTNFGFLGQQQYLVYGSVSNGGLWPDAYASGWPRKSYSTYVVLGRHTDAPVEAQVAQVETVQGVTLSAAVGSVAANGPAGPGRPDTVSYSPPGWDHVYGALTFVASGNALDANVAVGGAGTLVHPLFVVRGYTSAAYPTVRLGGATLIADFDYFASLRPSASEIWITLNRNLTGATNHLEVLSTPPAGRALYFIAPCRVYDSRNAAGPDAAAPALSSGEVRTLPAVGRCGIPSAARAIAANVTVVNPAAAGHLTFFPADLASPPVAQNVALTPGRTRACMGILTLAVDGSGMKVQNASTGSADFIVDVNGWFQ